MPEADELNWDMAIMKPQYPVPGNPMAWKTEKIVWKK